VSPLTPEQFAAETRVSRETLTRLEAYAALLAQWNERINLVARDSLRDPWRRHFLDSAQLLPLIPKGAGSLIDLGSGAGFPGLVLAELLRGRAQVTLFEATAKKCHFLEAVRDRLGLEVTIRNERMEEVEFRPFDVVTARACAPLDKLLGYAQHFVGRNTVCLFLKGQNVGSELTEARKSWKMSLQQHPSLTDPSGVVLEIRELVHAHRQASARDGRRKPEGRRR